MVGAADIGSDQVGVSLQFPDHGIVTDPAELGSFGISIIFEALFDEFCDAQQPLAFGTALVMSCYCMRQVINCCDEVCAAVGFGEPGNSCESGAVLTHWL
jgi:hypothetical protein